MTIIIIATVLIIIILIAIFGTMSTKKESTSLETNSELETSPLAGEVSEDEVRLKIKTYLYEDGGNLEVLIDNKEIFNNSVDMYSPHKPWMEYRVDPVTKGVHKVFVRLKVGEKTYEEETEIDFMKDIGIFARSNYNDKGVLEGLSIEEFDYSEELILN